MAQSRLKDISTLNKNIVMKLLRVLFVIGLGLMGFKSNAQQQAMFTQYMFNQLALNPAYAGIHEGISTSFLSRWQWVGFEGAPQTQTFSIHSPIKYRQVALGAVLVHDKIGITESYGLNLDYAYRIALFNDTKLSFGLQATLNQYKVDYTRSEGNDPVLASQNVSEFNPNFGAGIMMHADHYYVGFSMPILFNNEVELAATTDPNTGEIVRNYGDLVQHYFLTGGYVFPLSRNLKLKPNVLLKWVDGAPLEIDLNANLLINEIVWLGLSYRSLDSFDALIQFQATPNLQFGYAYDFYTTSDLRQAQNGSHEIMINFVFNKRSDKVVTPRYF